MTDPIVPPVSPGYGPVPMATYPNREPYANITPFTYRDGATYQEVLEGLRTWLRDVLVPHINETVAELDEAWAAETLALIAEFERIMAEYNEQFNDIIDSVAGAEVQDPIVASLILDENSSTSNALESIYATLSGLAAMGVRVSAIETILATGRLSVATLDTRFNAKADTGYVDTAISNLAAAKADKSTQTTVETGRLSQTNLDARYVQKPSNVHAVFIGSSNAAAGTWPEIFCTRQGWVCVNKTISGGGFTTSLDRRFDTQIDAAVADMSYDHNLVKYVFICDAGNDMRGLASVSANAPYVFQKATASYPNARVIMLPALWGIAALNTPATAMRSVSDRARELREAALPYKVEFIEDSWTWHWDDPNWMRPGEVHYTAAGYDRVVYFMERYLRTGETDNPSGWSRVTAVAGAINSPAEVYTRRHKNDVFLSGQFGTTGTKPVDTSLFNIAAGCWPLEEIRVPVVNVATRQSDATVDIFPNGLVRGFSTLNGATYHINTTYPAF